MNNISVNELSLREKIHIAAGNTFWSMGDVERVGLPKIMTTDASNGLRQQYIDEEYSSKMGKIPALCYPSLCALGCSFDTKSVFEIGKSLGEECKKRGISVLLGPGINIKRNPLCGRSFEYFSEDPLLSGKLGAAFIKGVQSTGVAACPKHLAANSQETRRAKSDSVVDDKTLFELYLRSFEIAVKEGRPWVIMGAYNRLNGIYCCENKWLLNDVLRKEWGFDGVVISDWGGINDIAKAINAGLDVEMPGGVTSYQDRMEDCVNNGEILEGALDKACRNVIKLAERTEESRRPGFDYEKDDHLKAARKAAESSFVLLKNEDILPLKKDEKILVVGGFAKRPRYQGAGSSKVKLEYAETPWMMLRDHFDSVSYETGFCADHDKNNEYYEKALAKAEKADKILVFAGIPETGEAEGFDRENMKLPHEQNRLIRALARRNKNIAVFIQAGAPVELLWKDDVRAIMACYLTGSCFGSAFLNIVTGKVSPSGRLAESYPVRVYDTPNHEIFPSTDKLAVYEEGTDIGYRYYNKNEIETAYPFGDGMSYTTFKYKKISASLEDDVIKVRCLIKNTGAMDSKEVVQIYISKKEAPLDRRLAAFEKVFIRKGEEKEVSLEIEPEYMSEFIGQDKAMVFSEGEYIISAGKNSAEMLADTEIEIDCIYQYPIGVKLNNSEDPENFTYIEEEESSITPNSSLRELGRFKVMKPVIKVISHISGKMKNEFILPEKLADYLMDSPLRQIPMGTNGKYSAEHVRKSCKLFDDLAYKRHKKRK